MSFAYANKLPGIEASVQSVENEFGWGPQVPFPAVGVVLASTALDATGTPTTVLRKGLVLGKITASGKHAQYDPAATDGSQFPVGVLRESVDLYDPRAGATTDRNGLMQVWGLVKPASLYGFDENARLQLSTRFVWDDLRQEVALDKVVAKTTSYTVLATDTNTTFTTTGAAGAVTFTLPTLARGLRFRFQNVVDQNMVVAGAAGTIVALNNAAATSVTFSTASQKIGAAVEVVANEAGTKWLAFFGSSATPTLA